MRDRRHTFVPYDSRRALQRVRCSHQLLQHGRRSLVLEQDQIVGKLARLCLRFRLEEREERVIVVAHARACESDAATRAPSSMPTIRSPMQIIEVAYDTKACPRVDGTAREAAGS